MNILQLKNPFGAPVYHEEVLSSTFDAARTLALHNEPHGTVITADFQEAGRGRQGRLWKAEKSKSLLFTILLRYGDFSLIPAAITLRAGLAVSLALEEFIPSLKGDVKVKWPNDIMIGSRKAVGILSEADGKNIFIGIGINFSQTEFPEEHLSKAISLIQAFPELNEDSRFILLEKILLYLYEEIECSNKPPNIMGWHSALSDRLYKKGEKVNFALGPAGSELIISGNLKGIGPGGELLIIPEGEQKERAFVTGELKVY
ncbi:MAG: biotin--[acetyl-CoA-carboxylase] ligase [Treponema sp.]|nr:biotin--[acetyl-CoA-carboxylase] ligase [Treponema sp.]